MKAIDLELIEDESRQNKNSRFSSGITRSYPMNPKFLATAQTTVGTLVLDLETQAQSIKFCYALSRLL